MFGARLAHHTWWVTPGDGLHGDRNGPARFSALLGLVAPTWSGGHSVWSCSGVTFNLLNGVGYIGLV